jgi:LytS/YehU family sensor histidine kinase
LRAQLDPHFLFNSLNTISVLMREDVDAADRVLVTLSRLLRRALEGSGAAEVPLREEVAFVEAYLEIEKARFADRLTYRVDVGPKLLEARVPSLLLQPLVENAVRHGLARRVDFETPGRIEIAAEEREGTLRLTVRDNGPGLDGTETPGVGLANTRSRLRLLYGDRHAFEMTPGAEGGVAVTIVLPLRPAEGRS